MLSAISGCAKNVVMIGGAEDFIRVPKGTVITGVKLPTDEDGKVYNVVVPKDGFWISLDADQRTWKK